MSNLSSLQNEIKYVFNDLNWLEIALTHSSYANEHNVENYERLEFLGDAVIELVVSTFIFSFKELDSGVLSKLRAGLVSTEYLSKISDKLGLVQLVRKSKSLNTLSKKNTADLFESLIGAIYLDGGLDIAKDIVYRYVVVSEENIQRVLKTCIDYKSRFQEEMQKTGKSFEYRLLNSFGLDHDKTFEYGLFIENELVSKGKGKSIHLAQEECSEQYYNK